MNSIAKVSFRCHHVLFDSHLWKRAQVSVAKFSLGFDQNRFYSRNDWRRSSNVWQPSCSRFSAWTTVFDPNLLESEERYATDRFRARLRSAQSEEESRRSGNGERNQEDTDATGKIWKMFEGDAWFSAGADARKLDCAICFVLILCSEQIR